MVGYVRDESQCQSRFQILTYLISLMYFQQIFQMRAAKCQQVLILKQSMTELRNCQQIVSQFVQKNQIITTQRGSFLPCSKFLKIKPQLMQFHYLCDEVRDKLEKSHISHPNNCDCDGIEELKQYKAYFKQKQQHFNYLKEITKNSRLLKLEQEQMSIVPGPSNILNKYLDFQKKKEKIGQIMANQSISLYELNKNLIKQLKQLNVQIKEKVKYMKIEKEELAGLVSSLSSYVEDLARRNRSIDLREIQEEVNQMLQ